MHDRSMYLCTVISLLCSLAKPADCFKLRETVINTSSWEVFDNNPQHWNDRLFKEVQCKYFSINLLKLGLHYNHDVLNSRWVAIYLLRINIRNYTKKKHCHLKNKNWYYIFLSINFTYKLKHVSKPNVLIMLYLNKKPSRKWHIENQANIPLIFFSLHAKKSTE